MQVVRVLQNRREDPRAPFLTPGCFQPPHVNSVLSAEFLVYIFELLSLHELFVPQIERLRTPSSGTTLPRTTFGARRPSTQTTDRLVERFGD